MMNNLPTWIYLAFLLLVLIIAGLAEYIGLAPKNSFYTVFLLVLGLIAPSPAFPHSATVVQTPQTTVNADRLVEEPPKAES